MKEEKMEVTTSLASGNPFEQSQSRFKSLKWFFLSLAILILIVKYVVPDSPYEEQDAGENVETIPEAPLNSTLSNMVAKHCTICCTRPSWSSSWGEIER